MGHLKRCGGPHLAHGPVFAHPGLAYRDVECDHSMAKMSIEEYVIDRKVPSFLVTNHLKELIDISDLNGKNF